MNAKVVADGEAEVSVDPGKVTTTFPLAGIAFSVLNCTLCMAVMGTINKSPAPNAAVGPVTKYTLFVPPDAALDEATVRFCIPEPTDCLILAVSEARYIFVPTSTIVAVVAFAAIPALRFAEVDGLEVEIVSDTLVSASAFLAGERSINNNNITKENCSFFI